MSFALEIKNLKKVYAGGTEALKGISLNVNLTIGTITLLISIGVLRGLKKGLIIEVSSLISLFFGIVGSINYSESLSEVIINYTKWNETAIKIFCFIIQSNHFLPQSV